MLESRSAMLQDFIPAFIFIGAAVVLATALVVYFVIDSAAAKIKRRRGS